MNASVNCIDLVWEYVRDEIGGKTVKNKFHHFDYNLQILKHSPNFRRHFNGAFELRTLAVVRLCVFFSLPRSIRSFILFNLVISFFLLVSVCAVQQLSLDRCALLLLLINTVNLLIRLNFLICYFVSEY